MTQPGHHSPRAQSNDQQQTQQPDPATLPQHGSHIQLQRGHIVHPHTVAIGTLHLQGMQSGRQLAERDTGHRANVVPFLLAIHAVGILHQIVVAIVQGSKTDGQVALVLINGQRLLVQYGVCGLLALKQHIGKGDVRAEKALLHLLRIKHKQSAGCSNPQLSLTVDGRQSFCQLNMIGQMVRVEAFHASRSRTIPAYFRLIDYPHVALPVFSHRHHITHATVQHGQQPEWQTVLQQLFRRQLLDTPAQRSNINPSVTRHQRLHHIAGT